MLHRSSLLLVPFAVMLSCQSAASDIEEIVVSATREAAGWFETNASISSISAETLSNEQAVHANEIFDNVAGIWISRGNGQENLTAIRSPVLTGAGGCGAFLTALDNIPLRASGFCNVNELFQGQLELASGVEVLKGPGTSVHGSNASHGMINILTPSLDGEDRSMLQVELGRFDYGRIKAKRQSDNWLVALSASRDGGYLDDAGYGQQKALIKHRAESAALNVTTTLSLTNLNQETAGFIRGDDVYKDDAVRRSNPNPEAYRDVQSALLYSSITPMDQSGDWQVTPYLRWNQMQFLQHFLPGQPLEDNSHRSIGAQSQWTLSESLRIGADMEFTTGSLYQFQDGPTQGSPFLVGTIPAGQHYDYEVDARQFALFASYEQPLSDRITAEFGLRAEQVRYDYDNLMIAGRTNDAGEPCGFGGCRFNRPEDRSDSFTNLAPKFSLGFDQGNNYWFFRAARGFRAPQATELYRLQNGQSVSNIDSESIDSVELGVRRVTARTTLQAALYGMRKDEFIFLDTSRANVDNGKTKHRGLELEWRYAASEALTIIGAGAVARHTYSNDPALARTPVSGNLIDTSPKTMGSISLDWQLGERFGQQITWVHMGRYYTDPANTNEYPGHDLIHWHGQFDLNEDLTLFFRVHNLTDEAYAERADFAFGSERYFVGLPRSFYIGFRFN